MKNCIKKITSLIIIAVVMLSFLAFALPKTNTGYAEESAPLPFKADLENLWKYNIGEGNSYDIAWEYNNEHESVNLRLDGNPSGYSPIEFTVDVDIDLYPIMSFEVIGCQNVLWSIKIYAGSSVGYDYAFAERDRSDNGRFSYDLRQPAVYEGDNREAFVGFSGRQTFKIKFFIVDKYFTGGSLNLKDLRVTADGYDGEYSEGINLNEKKEIVEEDENSEYLRRNEGQITFEDIIYPKALRGIPKPLYVTILVVLGLNIAFFIFMFFIKVYPILRAEYLERKDG